MKSSHRCTARAKQEIEQAMSEAQFTHLTHPDEVSMYGEFDDTIFLESEE